MERTTTAPVSPVTSVIGVVGVLVVALIGSGCASTPSAKRAVEPTSRASNGEKPSSPSTAASGAKRGGGYYLDDGPGDNPPPDLDLLPDAIPRVEKYASGANRPYNVFGTDYVPDLSGAAYRQRGVGSWYGRKFHGQRTSSGEIYDMYAMTAAHPTLPIPSYALVTNVSTGKSVIVRVNDRGPFLHNRIMDLSYAAAYKLGYMSSGSGMIEVVMLMPADIAAGRIPVTSNSLMVASAPSIPPNADAIARSAPPRPTLAATAEPRLPPAPTPVVVPPVNATMQSLPTAVIASATPSIDASTTTGPPAASTARLDPDIPQDLIPLPDREPAPALPSTSTAAGYYLQLGAFRAKAGANSFASHLGRLIDPALASRVRVSDVNGLWRVRVGPYAQRAEADSAASSVRTAISQPVLVLPDGAAR